MIGQSKNLISIRVLRAIAGFILKVVTAITLLRARTATINKEVGCAKRFYLRTVKTVALARLARYFFLFSQEKVSKKKATPLPLISCAASKSWAAAELGFSILKQSSLKSPNFSVLLGAARG